MRRHGALSDYTRIIAMLSVRQKGPDFHKSDLARLATNESHLLVDFARWCDPNDKYGQDMSKEGARLMWRWSMGKKEDLGLPISRHQKLITEADWKGIKPWAVKGDVHLSPGLAKIPAQFRDGTLIEL